MSITLNAAAVELFDSQVKKEYQEGYVLKGLCRQKTVAGANKIHFPKMGNAIARQKEMHEDVLPSNVAHSRVAATMENWYAAEYTDIFANNQTNFDEVSELSEVLKMGCGRRINKILIDALVASSGTTIANSVGGANTNMNFEKFVAAMGVLDDNGVPQEGRTFVMNHNAYRNLLNDEEFINSDYGQMRLDVTSQGNIKPYLGFSIVTLNDSLETDGTVTGLPIDGSSDRTLLAFHRDALGLGFNMDIRSEVSYQETKLATLSTVMFSAGAVAIDDAGIVKVTARQA